MRTIFSKNAIWAMVHLSAAVSNFPFSQPRNSGFRPAVPDFMRHLPFGFP